MTDRPLSSEQYTNQTCTTPPVVWVWKRADGYWEVTFSKPRDIPHATEYRIVS